MEAMRLEAFAAVWHGAAMFGFSPLDLIGFGCFVLVWAAYSLLVEHGGRETVTSRLAVFRMDWMTEMSRRNQRIVDSQLNGTLQQGSAFFASTSLVAIGGCATLLGSVDKAVQLVSMLPFDYQPTREAFEVKVLGLTIIFIYAFFKFGWAYRLFNYCAILIGSQPPPGDSETEAGKAHALRAGRMNIVAARHFNRGQRAFFFALAYLGWFVHPIALILASTGVALVVYRRQHASDALEALS